MLYEAVPVIRRQAKLVRQKYYIPKPAPLPPSPPPTPPQTIPPTPTACVCLHAENGDEKWSMNQASNLRVINRHYFSLLWITFMFFYLPHDSMQVDSQGALHGETIMRKRVGET